MTVGEMEARMTSREFAEWALYYKIRAAENALNSDEDLLEG